MRLTLGKSFQSMLVSKFSVTRKNLFESHTLDWSLHVCALPKNRLRRRHVLKHTTQLSCIRFIGNRSSFMPITFLQHSHCTFVIILFGPFARLFINLATCIRALFPKTSNHSWSCRTSILEGATFHKMSYCKFFKAILAKPSRDPTTGTSSSGTSGSRCFSLILLHERIRRRIRLCHLATLKNIVAETAIVSFRTLPVGFLLPTVSKNSLSTLFCPLIIDHSACFKISISCERSSAKLTCLTTVRR